MKHLLARAAEYGLRVHATHLEDGLLGLYSPSEGRIYFDIRLTPAERRSVLAHELGHAHFGHTCDSAANERQADAFAAELLIHPAEYARLERINDDPHYIADELHVTVDVVRAYRRHCIQRLGDRTYSRKFNTRFTNGIARNLASA